MALTIQQKDVQRIAVGCLYLMLEKAIFSFPGSTNAAPSFWVVVRLAYGDPVRGGDTVNFPFKVIWHVWERVVTPILLDESLWMKGVRAPKRNVELAHLGQWDTLIGNILQALMTKLRAEGYLPLTEDEVEATAAALVVTVDPEGDGEPLVRNPGGEAGAVDGSLTWPSGHLKLTYPIV
mgnify:CR=1 FL=1